jgi:hypothetical protein
MRDVEIQVSCPEADVTDSTAPSWEDIRLLAVSWVTNVEALETVGLPSLTSFV